jgi:hypothetical protein
MNECFKCAEALLYPDGTLRCGDKLATERCSKFKAGGAKLFKVGRGQEVLKKKGVKRRSR